MTLPASALPIEPRRRFSAWRRSLPERSGATGSMRAARRGRSPSCNAIDCRRCWRGCWRAATSRSTAVEDFLDPTIRKLMPDPYTVTAMEAAAKRIADAAMRGEKVAIFGDYDVDGATSAALLAWHLRHCGLDPLIHIPDRLFEGYGPNTDAVRALAGKGATLLVTVDCGTTSLEPLAEARRLGMSVVVIDHHQCGEDAARGRRAGQSEPAGRSLRPRPSRRGRARAGDAGGGEPRIARPRILDLGDARAGLARHAASRRARHRRRCGAADRAEPRFRRQRADSDAPAGPCRPYRADGRVAAERPAGSLASRFHAGTAHQCRRADRPRRSRGTAVARGRSFRRRRGLPPNSIGSTANGASSSRRRRRRPKPRRWPRLGSKTRARSSSRRPKAGIPASSASSRRG